MQDPTKPHRCICGRIHKVTVSKHTLHKGLIEALRIVRAKLKARGLRPNWNHLNIRKDIGEDFSRDQENNLSKLAFHGLLIHHKRGDWGITPKGIAFLDGKIRTPQGVRTIDREVVGTYGPLVSIHSFRGAQPAWEADAPVDQKQQVLV